MLILRSALVMQVAYRAKRIRINARIKVGRFLRTILKPSRIVRLFIRVNYLVRFTKHRFYLTILAKRSYVEHFLRMYDTAVRYGKTTAMYKSSKKTRKIFKKISDKKFKDRLGNFFFHINLIKMIKRRNMMSKTFLTQAIVEDKNNEDNPFKVDWVKSILHLRIDTVSKIYDNFQKNLELMKMAKKRFEKFKKSSKEKEMQEAKVDEDVAGDYYEPSGDKYDINPENLRFIAGRFVDPRKRIRMDYDTKDFLAILFTILKDYGCKVNHYKF